MFKRVFLLTFLLANLRLRNPFHQILDSPILFSLINVNNTIKPRKEFHEFKFIGSSSEVDDIPVGHGSRYNKYHREITIPEDLADKITNREYDERLDILITKLTNEKVENTRVRV